jgi:ATP-binding cassette subfamily F protein 3
VEKKNTSFQDQKKVKSLKNQLSTVESKISSLEKEIKTIDHDLLMDYDGTIAKTNFFDAYQSKKDTLEQLMENWEHLSTEIDTIA